MVKKAIVAVKLAELADRLSRVQKHCPADLPALVANQDALDIVSFNLMLAVQCAVDIASHIISDEGFESVGSLAGSFARLEAHGVLSAPVAAAMARACGLRNIVAHGYSAVDVAVVFAAAQSGPRDLETFAQEVAVWTSRRTSP